MYTTGLYHNGVKYEWGKLPQPITESGIYWSADLGLISLSSDGSTRITIADKNLGATTVYNSGDTLSEANCGKYYQRGNNYGFPRTGTVTTSSTRVNASSYGPGNYYSSSTFVTTGGQDWFTDTTNYNLWGETTNTNEARRGPCTVGRHVPSKNELTSMTNIMTSLGISNRGIIKMPKNGNRVRSSGNTQYQTSYIYLWSSTKDSDNNAYYLGVVSGASISYVCTAMGYSIRPFKNVAVQPTEDRTKLN